MRNKRLIIAGIGVSLLVLSSVCVFGEIIDITTEEIIQETDLIITGEVEGVESAANQRGHIYSDATIRVTEVIKGSLADSRITVEFEGGVVNGAAMDNPDVTPLNEGDKVLLFLIPDKSAVLDRDVYTINYFMLGTFKIFNIAGIDITQGVVDRLVDGKRRVFRDMPLNELIEIIRSVE